MSCLILIVKVHKSWAPGRGGGMNFYCGTQYVRALRWNLVHANLLAPGIWRYLSDFCTPCASLYIYIKGKVIPITGPVWPRGWVEV